MFSVKSVLNLIPWLSYAICFCPDPSALLPRRPHAARPNVNFSRRYIDAHTHIGQKQRHGRDGRRLIVVVQSQSVNNDVGGFHYDQEPRGTSFISQISKQDLWERRQMKRPLPRTRPHRRPAPNSRGAGGSGASNNNTRPRRQKYVEENIMDADLEGDVDDELDKFKDSVSTNLNVMTDLLKEMQRSQSAQTNDVQALSLKVADLSDRLTVTEIKNQMANNGNNAPDPGDAEDKNFGTSLDGKFNQKIKDVRDEINNIGRGVDPSAARDYGMGQQGGGEYYRTKIGQLESRIDRIDESLQATDEKLDSQMDYVDQRLDEMMDDVAFENNMPFQPRPPPGDPFLEERPPPPPPLEELPPPPPPPGGPPQDSYDNPYYVDDGTRYYQERNYNEPNVPPPRMQEISSLQKKQSNDSVNERSTGHHYNERNGSFISAFSKAENRDRRRFDPFGDPRRGGNQISAREQLPRGARPRSGGGFAVRTPESMAPQYFEGQDYYEDGPMMEGPMMDGPMEEDFYYDENMYEF